MRRWRIGGTISALVLLAASAFGQSQRFLVSIPTLKLNSNERIVGFEIHVQSGMTVQLPKVPKGWRLSVDNDPSWNTNMKGSLAVGAAALDADFFLNLLVIEGETEATPDRPLNLSGEVIVTSDYVSERRIKLGTKDFVLVTVPAATNP